MDLILMQLYNIEKQYKIYKYFYCIDNKDMDRPPSMLNNI